MVLLAKKQTQRIVFILKNTTSNMSSALRIFIIVIVFTLKNATSIMHQPDTARRENIVFTLKNATSNMTMLIKH